MTDDYKYPNSIKSLPVVSNPPAPAAATPAPPPPATEKSAAAGVAVSNHPADAIQKKLLEGKIIEALRSVYDPEIPVSIYELGLIYEVNISDDRRVMLKMTLTAPGCPVAGSLVAEVQRKIEAIEEVTDAEVQLVWDPPWTKDRMSDTALLELGL